jgi:S-adenosylmethionine hydrolase
VDTYSDITPGECGILVGSTGLLEIAAYKKSAQEFTQLSLGDPVTLLF